jgi:hypothetical protein
LTKADDSRTVLITVLKKIVNEAWGLDSLDSTKLAKYMRCLFQVALSNNPAVAEGLLDQIYHLAEETSEVILLLRLKLIEANSTID